LARSGKIRRIAWMVDTEPTIQKSKIGLVSGVFRLIFFCINKAIHTRRTDKTTKSSALIYTQVLTTSRSGFLG